MRREGGPFVRAWGLIGSIVAAFYVLSKPPWERPVIWGTLIAGVTAFWVAVVMAVMVLHYSTPAAPTQPIYFKHSVMVGEMGIDCYFCHPDPAVSRNAGMPSVDKCLYCHYVIKVNAVKTMQHYAGKGEGIPWKRVVDLPGYVKFNHECHIAGGHKCSVCHGDVAHMDRVHIVHNFNMNFCISCHRKYGVSIDCFLCHY